MRCHVGHYFGGNVEVRHFLPTNLLTLLSCDMTLAITREFTLQLSKQYFT